MSFRHNFSLDFLIIWNIQSISILQNSFLYSKRSFQVSSYLPSVQGFFCDQCIQVSSYLPSAHRSNFALSCLYTPRPSPLLAHHHSSIAPSSNYCHHHQLSCEIWRGRGEKLEQRILTTNSAQLTKIFIEHISINQMVIYGNNFMQLLLHIHNK